MSDLFVDVVIAVVAIACAAAWLYFPKQEPQVRDGQGSRHHRPGSLALSRHKENPARITPRRRLRAIVNTRASPHDMKTLLAAAAFAITGAVTVQAADISPGSGLGYVMHDGQVERACTSPVITYWTKLGERFVVNYVNERDGCHVLVTTQRGERLFDAVLAAGQSAAVSIPRAAGEAPVRIVLSDAGGYLDIAEPPAAVSTQ